MLNHCRGHIGAQAAFTQAGDDALAAGDAHIDHQRQAGTRQRFPIDSGAVAGVTGDEGDATQAQIAQELGINQGALKVAIHRLRKSMGFDNVVVMIPFCRTLEEGRRVQAEMEKHGLKRGRKGLEIYVMCEIPSNVILAEEFAEIFDGFSIGSNDLTQLILGVDRDSEIVAPIFDERNEAVKIMIAQVIATCRAHGCKIGICGQAPSDYPEFAQFLVEQQIDSISLNPDTVLKTTLAILATEKSVPDGAHP